MDGLFDEFYKGTGDRKASTTMVFVRILSKLLRDKEIGNLIVPIVPDEARTFGMESLFRAVGIYSHVGQKYEPVDMDTLLYYKEAQDGQILEEGITEAGSIVEDDGRLAGLGMGDRAEGERDAGQLTSRRRRRDRRERQTGIRPDQERDFVDTRRTRIALADLDAEIAVTETEARELGPRGICERDSSFDPCSPKRL